MAEEGVIKNKGTINQWFDEAYIKFDKEGKLVSGPMGGQKSLLQYSDFQEFLINEKGLSKETAETLIKNIKEGVISEVKMGPNLTGGITPDFASKAGYIDTGINRNAFTDFGVQQTLDSIYTPSAATSAAVNITPEQRTELNNRFFRDLKNSDGPVEFYLRQVSRVNVPAENITFRLLNEGTASTLPYTSQAPGFYTEPIGGLSPGDMASGGGILPTENYYKVQLDTNNLLLQGPGIDFNQQVLEKIDWNSFQQNTGMDVSWVDEYFSLDKPPVGYQNFHSKLATEAAEQGIDYRTMYKGLRQAGYEGVVYYQGTQAFQMEVILLDPNDTLNVGKKVNIENSNINQFLENDRKVNQLDELVIKPTNVVDDVTPASVVDEAVEYVDNLNIDNAIKKEVKDKIVKVTGQASGAIPIPGVGQAIDLWETAVLVVGAAALAAGEIDELPKVIYNYGLDLYESILSGYNIPFQPAKRKEYNPNLERISAGLTWIDRLQPTSYAINPVIEEYQETAATTPTMEIPGFGTVPASEYYQPPVQSTPERDNINTIMTNLMTNISNAQGAYPRTRREIELFGRNPIQVVPQDTADKPEKVEYDSKEKQNLHDIYAELYKNLSNASARIQ